MVLHCLDRHDMFFDGLPLDRSDRELEPKEARRRWRGPAVEHSRLMNQNLHVAAKNRPR